MTAVKATKEEMDAARDMVLHDLKRMSLSDQQIGMVLGWMTAGQGLPMIRYGQAYGLINMHVYNGLPPKVERICPECKQSQWVREGDMA